jgi:hypothetical protein
MLSRIRRVLAPTSVRQYGAEQGVSQQEALQKRMEEKPRDFILEGNELYART